MFKDVQQLKDALCEMGYETSIVFENPDYASAAVGISEGGAVIYDYDLMVESLMEEEGMDATDAMEFIDYNTVRALPYIGPGAPIIMYRLDGE